MREGMRGKSTILGTRPLFVGCCFGTHSLAVNGIINICLYELNDEFLIAISEPTLATVDQEKQYAELGSNADGNAVAPYVTRGLQNVNAAEFKTLMTGLFPDFELHWMEGFGEKAKD